MPETTITYSYDSIELLIASSNIGIGDNDEDFQQILNCLARLPDCSEIPISTEHKRAESEHNADSVPRRNEYSAHSGTYNDLDLDDLSVQTFDPSNTAYATKIKQGEENFPCILFHMLEDSHASRCSNIISWLPHGLAFQIYDEKLLFKHHIFKKYFKSTFESFKRQLYIYGFTKIGKRFDDFGAYCHHRFIRGRQDLCSEIVICRNYVPEISCEDINFDEVPKTLNNLSKAMLAKGNKRKKIQYFR